MATTNESPKKTSQEIINTNGGIVNNTVTKQDSQNPVNNTNQPIFTRFPYQDTLLTQAAAANAAAEAYNPNLVEDAKSGNIPIIPTGQTSANAGALTDAGPTQPVPIDQMAIYADDPVFNLNSPLGLPKNSKETRERIEENVNDFVNDYIFDGNGNIYQKHPIFRGLITHKIEDPNHYSAITNRLNVPIINDVARGLNLAKLSDDEFTSYMKTGILPERFAELNISRAKNQNPIKMVKIGGKELPVADTFGIGSVVAPGDATMQEVQDYASQKGQGLNLINDKIVRDNTNKKIQETQDFLNSHAIDNGNIYQIAKNNTAQRVLGQNAIKDAMSKYSAPLAVLLAGGITATQLGELPQDTLRMLTENQTLSAQQIAQLPQNLQDVFSKEDLSKLQAAGYALDSGANTKTPANKGELGSVVKDRESGAPDPTGTIFENATDEIDGFYKADAILKKNPQVSVAMLSDMQDSVNNITDRVLSNLGARGKDIGAPEDIIYAYKNQNTSIDQIAENIVKNNNYDPSFKGEIKGILDDLHKDYPNLDYSVIGSVLNHKLRVDTDSVNYRIGRTGLGQSNKKNIRYEDSVRTALNNLNADGPASWKSIKKQYLKTQNFLREIKNLDADYAVALNDVNTYLPLVSYYAQDSNPGDWVQGQLDSYKNRALTSTQALRDKIKAILKKGIEDTEGQD